MKISLFFSLLIISCCYMPGPPPYSIPWKLEIKNEYGNDDQIVLISGRYTRITFILFPEDGQKYLDYSQLNSKFKIYLSDKNIKTDEDEYEINPAKSLEYSAYIGLKCQNNISKLNYTIQFLIKDSNNMQIELNISPVTVAIDRTPTKIKLVPFKTYLPEKSYSFFKLGDELYNINELKIIQKNKDNKNANFFYTNVEIKEYDTDNDSSEKRFFNEEILLHEYPYGISSSYENLGNETEYTFELELSEDNEEDKECFILDENYRKLTIKALNETPVILTNLTKEAILYSFENITPKKDESSNIQIKFNIPVAPIFLTCELKTKKEDDKLIYTKYIYETGEQIFKFDNLKINAEYNIKCKFESINNEKDEKSSFHILIGNKPGNDIITKIVSSKDINRTPQCAIFTFGINSTINDLKEFEKLSEKYCYYIMNEEETIMNRIMEIVKCESDKIDDEEDDDDKENIRNKYMVCAGPSNENYDKIYNRNKKINFNENFEKLIDNLSNESKINESLGISGLKVESLERYYDNEAPDINKIEIIKLKGKNDEKLKFNITSKNSQPIKCYHNEELNSNNKKKFISLEIDDVVLNEGETKKIETKIMAQPEEGAMLSLFMICYNLPGFSIKYESTGIFTAFTYYYSTTGEEDDNDEKIPKGDILIDCKEENNRGHPYCLKDRSNHIIEEIKTKMPDFIEDIMEKSDLFEKLTVSSQLTFLEKAKKELVTYLQKMAQNEESKENRKEVVEKLTELAEYLNKRDCSTHDNDIEYNECRNKKKEILTDLIKAIGSYFKCNILTKIIKEGMTNDIEQNLKYILFLISEITNNADSLKKGESEVLYNITLCLQESFEDYWNNVQNNLEERSSLPEAIRTIKKDISFILMKSLTNLINILHYDEIDGYVKNDDISKAGIMENSEGKKILKGIFNFIKNFNDFGNGIYSISDKMKISVTTNDENKEKNNIRTRLLLEEQLNIEEDNDEQIYNISDKGIYVILHPKKMMQKKGGYAVQLVIYDSPLIPIQNKKSKNVRDFISITIYDKNGNEIDITDLSEEERPIILYNKTLYKKLRHCFYYDEKKEELDTNGIVSTYNYVYRNEKYFRCSSKHLTSFTAGDYSSSSNPSNWWKVFLIILACLIVLAIAVFAFIHFRKNSVDSQSIEKNFPNEEGMISV